MPAALIEMRSYQSFLHRLPSLGDLLRVAGPPGAPQGLCSIKGDELDQLFVARAARGTGLAARARRRRGAAARAGVEVAHLDCVIENARAISFYGKHGWARERIATVTLAGPFRLETLILSRPAPRLA